MSGIDNIGYMPPKAYEVWKLISHGIGRKEIAGIIKRSVKTVEFHMGFVHEFLGVENDLQAALLFWEVLPEEITDRWKSKADETKKQKLREKRNREAARTVSSNRRTKSKPARS